jgi:MoaA/NifB/PqqE/SkfB family radical SAM enzyme
MAIDKRQLPVVSLEGLRHSDFVELTIHFRCNLRCQHCMILESMRWLEPADDAEFEALLSEQRTAKGWKALILTGSEVTLRKDLPHLVRRAIDAGFEFVRIQTHGMRLADESYCRELVEAGVKEFFVSVTAGNESLHDQITRVPGSFAKTIRGLENLQRFKDVRSLTNTVVTAMSYVSLPEVVERLKGISNLTQMHFWTYWPMSAKDDLELCVSHPQAAEYLKTAIELARSYGRFVEVKNFPQCLLGKYADALCNDQPELRIDPRFWTEFHRNGFHQCAYKSVCASTQCLGLNTAYADRFGWHEDLLRPLSSGDLERIGKLE